MFKIQGYILDKIEDKNNKILLHCHIQRKTMIYNSERSNNINETRERRLSHMLLEDQLVIIIINQRKFYFPKQKTKRWELLPDVNQYNQTTNTFRLNALRELQRDNYSQTGLKRGMSGMFMSKLLDKLNINIKWNNNIKKVGLDGKGASKHKLIHNLTDIGNKKPIAVFSNLNQKDLKKN